MNILIVGAPGSGKGTLSKYLSESLGNTHLSTGELFRYHMTNETEIGKEVKALINAGGLAGNDTTVKMVQDFIDSNDKEKGFIFDGFPRTVEQLGLLDEILEKNDLWLDVVIYLKVPEDILIDRLTKRATLEDRPEDADLEYSTKRIKLFNERTYPLIEKCKEDDHIFSLGFVYEIDGSQSIDAVRAEVGKRLLKKLTTEKLVFI